MAAAGAGIVFLDAAPFKVAFLSTTERAFSGDKSCLKASSRLNMIFPVGAAGAALLGTGAVGATGSGTTDAAALAGVKVLRSAGLGL